MFQQSFGRRHRLALAKHVSKSSFREVVTFRASRVSVSPSKGVQIGKYRSLCTRIDNARSAIQPLFQTMILSEHGAQLVLRRLFSVQTALVLTWIVAILWGERWSFQSSLAECEWPGWETWASIPDTNVSKVLMKTQPAEANPHHVVLIADPQLVDAHTYPGRPWPLSTLTILYTDLYLKRSYRLLQKQLDPDSVFFLGDLFDGGREWGRPPTAEKRYKNYGNKYWMKEYGRFVRMFLRGWRGGQGISTAESRGRKIVASLPGNHDLGFATKISSMVRERFDAYCGPLNRIDVVGNHTFVSLDTVSLSAMDQPDPVTGGSGAGDGTASSTANSAIWQPAHEFLENGKETRRRAIQREIGQMLNRKDQYYLEHGFSSFSPNITSAETPRTMSRMNDQAVPPTSSYPTILLTHVPLFRPKDTDCGPLRERGNAISITAGYQYQNVLTPKISADIVSKLGAGEVAQVYSGDDHDYCEIEHNEFTGRIKEITVKSMSWAMGVRKPGFLAVSLWNPVDLHKPRDVVDTAMPKGTIQNHLCLLPDQLSIFIRYGQLLGVTLVALLVSTVASRSRRTSEKLEPLLPLAEHIREDSHSSQSSAFSASPDSGEGYLSTRLAVRQTARPASPSRLGGYGNLPAISRSSSPVKGGVMPPPSQKQSKAFWSNDIDSDDWGMPLGRKRVKSRSQTLLQNLGRNIRDTAIPVLVFYFWLLWNE